MATTTDNYQLLKPTYAEQADIGVINSNMNIIDDIMHSSQISLAPAYDSTQTYAEGDVVMYELLMYKCIAPTTGVWDGSKWERTTASESGGGGSAELDILGEGNGAIVSFSDGASAGLAKCIAEIVPTQAGSGTPSPDNVRAISGASAVNVAVSGKNLCSLSTINVQTISNHSLSTIIPAGTYYVSWKRNQGSDGVGMRFFYEKWDTSQSVAKPVNDHIVTFERPVVGMSAAISSFTSGTIISEIQIEFGTTATEYEPYAGSTTTTPLGQTVYGGQLNVLTGILNITWGYIASYNGETLPNEWISDRDEYASGTTPTTGAEVAYKLATPQTVQLTPQEVNSLLGENNISADTGDIDIVYVKASAPIQPNPTGEPTATLSKLGIEGTVFEIPSGGGGSSGEVIYSTTERVIGTWIDGKPVYEITLVGNISATIAIPSLINIIELSGGVTDNNGLYFVPICWNSGNSRVICHQSNDGELSMANTTDRTLYRITLRYTKITD